MGKEPETNNYIGMYRNMSYVGRNVLRLVSSVPIFSEVSDMIVLWLVTVLLVRDVLMDNLQDLMIIDSLLKNYDRRATPTNRMGKYCVQI